MLFSLALLKPVRFVSIPCCQDSHFLLSAPSFWTLESHLLWFRRSLSVFLWRPWLLFIHISFPGCGSLKVSLCLCFRFPDLSFMQEFGPICLACYGIWVYLHPSYHQYFNISPRNQQTPSPSFPGMTSHSFSLPEKTQFWPCTSTAPNPWLLCSWKNVRPVPRQQINSRKRIIYWNTTSWKRVNPSSR